MRIDGWVLAGFAAGLAFRADGAPAQSEPRIERTAAASSQARRALQDRPPYEGLWASSEAACRDEDGVERMEIGRGRLFWYETRCRADGITAAGPRSWTMRLSCEGEGQRFSARPSLTLATPDRLVIERSPVGPGKRQVYARCPHRR
jgi:hypothetical protein